MGQGREALIIMVGDLRERTPTSVLGKNTLPVVALLLRQ
jgi:hypothetical protein